MFYLNACIALVHSYVCVCVCLWVGGWVGGWEGGMSGGDLRPLSPVMRHEL